MTTILLVEDDPLQAFIRTAALERKFHNVQRVGDPALALCMIQEAQFAGNLGLVIADLHMPGIKGPEFVAELHTRLPSLPILVLLDRNESSRAYEADGVQFVTRPGSDEMLTVAAELLSSKNRR